MNILYVNGNVIYENEKGMFIYRGNGTFLVELARLVDRLELFQFRMKFRDNDCLADFNITDKGFDIVSIPRGRRIYLPYFKAVWVGFRRIRKSDFLYLSYPGNICMIMAIFAILQRKPFGLYVRGEKGVRSKISRYLFRHAVISLTISPVFTKFIRTLKAPAETIRPMIEYREADILQDRRYPTKEIYQLLYVGRIEYFKGIYDLVDAIKIIIDRKSTNIHMSIVGDGADANKIKHRVAALGLSKYVTFQGTVSDHNQLAYLYRQSDLFILPTHHEGFPRVLYESMIAGLPIITTFVGTISHLMKDGFNCYRIPPKNPSALAEKVIQVLQDYENTSTVAFNGTETIKNYLGDKAESHAVQLMRILLEKGLYKGAK